MNPSHNRVIGALLIVAGTTIGAGMLGLPMTSVRIGFVNSAWLLFIMWAVMAFTALVTLEINLKAKKIHKADGVSVVGLSKNAFGNWGYLISSLSLFLLFYALLAAYIAGSSSLIKNFLDDTFRINSPFAISAVLYTVVLGGCINACVKMVDYANRLFFTLKLVAFAGMVILLLPHVRLENLSYHQEELSLFSLAAPIFFTSFGFHGSIPTLINYVGPNPRQLRFIILTGSFLPLLVYLIWQVVTLGVLPIPEATSVNTNLADFVQNLSIATNSSSLKLLISIFTFLAVTTSFLGVAIGLFDSLAETFKLPNQTQSQRLKISLLTFTPPVFFALFYPNGFIMALGYAAIALSLLAVLIPTAIAFKWRQNSPLSAYQVTGGKVALVLAFGVGLLIIVFELFKS